MRPRARGDQAWARIAPIFVVTCAPAHAGSPPDRSVRPGAQLARGPAWDPCPTVLCVPAHTQAKCRVGVARNLQPTDGVSTPRYILLALLVTQLADAATFTFGVARFGIGLESNGVAAMLYQATGLDGVLLAKAAVLLLTIALLVVAATRFPRLLVWGGAAATSLGLLGFAANTASILILS